jgi:outer membrane protein OmpA-like peptidoglycan-associated protein/tetratricopeptide (TPR) repeat protein
MVLSVGSFAGSSSTVDLGNKYYKQFDFKKAVFCYLKALKHDKKNTSLQQHIADCYRLMNNWAAAKPYYAQLVAHSRVKPQNYVYYAEALREGKDYPNAKIYYAKYLELFPEDSSVREQVGRIDRVQDLLTSRVVYEIKNMRDINSPVSEFGVTLYGLNDVYFCSNRKPDHYVKRTDSWTNNSFLKIYTAEVADSTGKLRNPSLLPSTIVNKMYHEAAPCYNEKMDELYFDRSNYDGKRAFYSADRTVKLKIYKVSYSPDAGKWDGELKEAVPFNSREYSVCHPSLNKRADTLYFTSDMPGGYGRSDLYLSVRQRDGEWGAPVNLGPGINTSGDDMFPFIADDGTLYFASNGHMGLGGLDIFYSKYEKGNWSEPRNMGAPLNSNMDDFGILMRKDNKSGYFVSNRAGGLGDDDIYSFNRIGYNVTGVTYNGYTGDMIVGATVEMKPNVNPSKSVTAADGSFGFNAETNFNYTFTANKPEYHEAKKELRVTDSTGTIRIPMYPEGDLRLEVKVLDKKSNNPMDSAEVKINGTMHYTNKDGIYSMVADTGAQYKIEVYKETGKPEVKYLKVIENVSTVRKYPPTVIRELVLLDSVGKVRPIKLDNIYYDLDKWNIRPDAAIELNKLVKILKDNPTMEIELSSHTDCRGTADYNMDLSRKRAESAVEYIVTQGIDKKRMTAAGYGESKLVNYCQCEGDFEVICTEARHQENRRTEFKIKKF